MATAPVEAITDAEAFGSYLEKSETQLIVMDVHQNWCGPWPTSPRMHLSEPSTSRCRVGQWATMPWE